MQSQLKQSNVVRSHGTGRTTCCSFVTIIIQCSVCIVRAFYIGWVVTVLYVRTGGRLLQITV